MTDTPIYDAMLTNPFRRGRQALIVTGGGVITAPSRTADNVLNGWLEDHHADIAAALAPYGIHPYDIARPQFERVVYADELPLDSIQIERGAVVEIGPGALFNTGRPQPPAAVSPDGQAL